MKYENIIKLLKSRNHEDRALGIEFLEQLPNYKDLLKTEVWDIYTGMLIGEEGPQNNHTTHIFTENGEYWITNDYLLINTTKEIWGPAEKTIRI